VARGLTPDKRLRNGLRPGALESTDGAPTAARDRQIAERMPTDTTSVRPRRPAGDAATPVPRRTGADRPAGRLVAVDGLRFAAALMVLAFHYTGREGGTARAWGGTAPETFPELYRITSYGWLGVELFFVISGFVICMSAWGRTPGQFFRSRITRLMPAYWPAVLLTFAVVSLYPAIRGHIATSDLLLNLTMLNDPFGVRHVDGVYWTLWVETRFYLLFLLVLWRGLTYRRTLLFCYGWTVAAAVASAVDEPLLTLVVQPGYAPYFVAGIAFYLIRRFGSDLNTWGLVAVSFLIAQHHVVDRVAATVGQIGRPLAAQPAMAFIGLVFAVMAAVALGKLDWVRWGWLTTAGVLTYPLYLLHEHIGWVLIAVLREHLPRYVVLGGVTAAMLLASWLLHRLVEKPGARLLRRLLEKRAPGRHPWPPADPAGPPVAPQQAADHPAADHQTADHQAVNQSGAVRPDWNQATHAHPAQVRNLQQPAGRAQAQTEPRVAGPPAQPNGPAQPG
jgi:peptidoglycan/LPS O-acetylase OafA/YrhL